MAAQVLAGKRLSALTAAITPFNAKRSKFSRSSNRLAGGLQCPPSVNAFLFGLPFRTSPTKLNWFRFLPLLLAASLPASALATVNASLMWVASSDPSVTGYDIYYGTASQQFTNLLDAGDVTNTVVPDLAENTTYFFAAKAHDSAGDESDFSNQAAFVGVNATPESGIRLRTLPKNFTSDPLLFSLDTNAPPGATINPTNGILAWSPGHAYATTTNYLNVYVTDTVNPALNISETVLVVVSDYLEFQVGTTAVSAGQSASLPLLVAASTSVSNLQVTLNWPGNQLLNPTLTCVSPMVAGSLTQQGDQVVIQLQTAATQPLTGTNLVGQVNFQAAAGQTSTLAYSISAGSVAGSTADATAYANVSAQAGEVVVVGNQPMLRPQAATGAGRTLTLFANPGNYQLLTTTSLLAPVTWTPLMTCQQTNAAQSVSLDPTIPAVFYQLQQL